MQWRQAITRAKRGLREELTLYLVAVSSLSVAFLAVGGALVGVFNLAELNERWGGATRMSAYLQEAADPQEILTLQQTLLTLDEVDHVEHLSSEAAQARFLADADVSGELANLPAEAFPPSLEITLSSGVPVQRAAQIAERVGRFGAVAEVETYRTFYERLSGLLGAGRALVLLLTLLVGLCVLAVIGNTIRLSLARRRDEIAVLKLCGATDRFVQGPFVLEGAFQGALSAAVATVLLLVGFFMLRDHLDATVAALTGMRAAFLPMWVVFAMVLSGGVVGALGSAMSLRRYMTV